MLESNAAGAVGVAQNALDLAISYASNRKQFNKPIINFERVYNKIAMMIIEIVFGRQLHTMLQKIKILALDVI